MANRFLIVVDMQNDFIDGALGTKEAVAIVPNVKEKIITYYYDSLNALKMIEASKIETEAADISLELSLANMKAGEATFIDVIASQNLKVQANINLIKKLQYFFFLIASPYRGFTIS